MNRCARAKQTKVIPVEHLLAGMREASAGKHRHAQGQGIL